MLNTRKTYWEDLAAKHNIDPATLFAKAEEEAKTAAKPTKSGGSFRLAAKSKERKAVIKVEPETTGTQVVESPKPVEETTKIKTAG